MIRSREFTYNGQVVARLVERSHFDLAKNQSRNVLKVVNGYAIILKAASDAKKHVPLGSVAGPWTVERV